MNHTGGISNPAPLGVGAVREAVVDSELKFETIHEQYQIG